MSKKDNIPKGVQQEFADVDYWHKLSRKPTIVLDDGTIISEYEWMKKYMYESYGNSFSRTDSDSNILKTDEHKKQARRNNNNTNRDALNVMNKTGRIVNLFQIEDHEYGKTESEPWEKSFKKDSYEQSFRDLIQFSAEEVGMDFSESNTKALLRMYFRIKRFLKMVKKDMTVNSKKCKQCKETKPREKFYAHRLTKDGLMHSCAQCIKGKK